MIKKVIVNRTNGKYLAGDDGHIYCYSTAPCYLNRIQPVRLCEWVGSRGYKFVSMVVDSKRKNQNVHSVICTVFYGKKPKGMCCRHIDGNKFNNCLCNLAWGTYCENENDKRLHGRIANGEKQGKAKLTKDAVLDIRGRVPLGLLTTKEAGNLYGVTADHITSVIRRRVWKHI